MPNEKTDELKCLDPQLANTIAVAGSLGPYGLATSHMLDTFSKRIQLYPKEILAPYYDATETFEAFRSAISPKPHPRFISLLGSTLESAGWNLTTKVFQATTIYSTHFWVTSYLNSHLGSDHDTPGAHIGKNFFAGWVSGIMALSSFPLETRTVISQTNVRDKKDPTSFNRLTRGIRSAALRNSIALSFFFGSAEAIKLHCERRSIEGNKKFALASGIASTLRTVLPYQLSTTTTYMQHYNIKDYRDAMRNLCEKPIPGRLYRGIGTRILSQVPIQAFGLFIYLKIFSAHKEKRTPDAPPLAHQSIFSRLDLDNNNKYKPRELPTEYLAKNAEATAKTKPQTRGARP